MNRLYKRAERLTYLFMKSKLSWVTFIPLFLAAAFFKSARFFMSGDSLFGLSELQMDYLFLGAVVLIFLFTALFCLIDRKISAYYVPRRNYAAGIIAVCAALIFAGEGADEVFRMISSGAFTAINVIDAILLLISAVVFVVLGLTHSLRDGSGKSYAMLTVIPAILFAEKMIGCFIGFTTVSIRFADVPLLACYVFLSMFFFNYTVVLSLIRTKRAVKSCFIFGLPAAAASIVYGAVKLIFDPDTHNLVSNAQPLALLLTGAYILSFLIEVTANVRDRDSVVVLEGDEETVPEVDEGDAEGFLVSSDGTEPEEEVESSYYSSTDTKDFLYTETEFEDQEPETADPGEAEGYLTEESPDDDDDDRPSDYETKLDKIDKLILEISEKSD